MSSLHFAGDVPFAAFVGGGSVPAATRTSQHASFANPLPPGSQTGLAAEWSSMPVAAVAASALAMCAIGTLRRQGVGKRRAVAFAAKSAASNTVPIEHVESRLAMIAALPLQDNESPVELGYGACCSLRAFENEIGAIPPLGYFDPLGLSRDGDVREFCRRREAELKNGRVAMYATIGYIVPEYWRVPGFLSPSMDIRFEEVPNGIYAVETVPVEGWLQIIAWCGFFEMVVNYPPHPTEPGNYYKGRFGVFWNKIITNPVDRRNALNKEISNGRLAMIAILAMMVQNGVVGTTQHAMWYGN